MKVRELQEKLARMDPEKDLLCYSEDVELLNNGRGFILLDILGATETQGVAVRLDDGTPYLKFGESPTLETVATLEVTANF